MQKKLKIVLTSLNRSKKSAHCLRCAGHAPVGLSKRGRDAILYLFIVYIHGFRFLLHHLCRMHGAVCHPQIRDTVIDQGNSDKLQCQLYHAERIHDAEHEVFPSKLSPKLSRLYNVRNEEIHQ